MHILSGTLNTKTLSTEKAVAYPAFIIIIIIIIRSLSPSVINNIIVSFKTLSTEKAVAHLAWGVASRVGTLIYIYIYIYIYI